MDSIACSHFRYCFVQILAWMCQPGVTRYLEGEDTYIATNFCRAFQQLAWHGSNKLSGHWFLSCSDPEGPLRLYCKQKPGKRRGTCNDLLSVTQQCVASNPCRNVGRRLGFGNLETNGRTLTNSLQTPQLPKADFKNQAQANYDTAILSKWSNSIPGKFRADQIGVGRIKWRPHAGQCRCQPTVVDKPNGHLHKKLIMPPKSIDHGYLLSCLGGIC